MDSTAITATAWRTLNGADSVRDFRAYTIAYETLIEDDELEFARLVAEAEGFPHEVLVAEEFVGRPPEREPAHRYPEPAFIPTQLAEVEITRRVSAYARVLFAGFGGDPALFPIPSALGAVARRLRLRARRWLDRPRELPSWLDRDFATRTHLLDRYRIVWRESPQTDRLGMIESPLWSNIFGGSDPGYTGVPVKVRFPFFDVALVELLAGLPSDPWFRDKHLLREAMTGVLPEPVRNRPKTAHRGLAPLNKLNRDGAETWMTELLRTPEIRPYIKGNALLGRLESRTLLGPEEYFQLAQAWNLAYWLHTENSR